MTVLPLPLPENLEAFIAMQVVVEGYPSATEYIIDLVRRAQRRKSRGRLEKALLEATKALDRGEGEEVTPAEWAELCAELARRFGEPAI